MLYYLTREGGRPVVLEAESAEAAEAAQGDGYAVLWELERAPGDHEEVDEATGEIVFADPAGLDAELHARIDREAGALRLRFITDAPGQAMTYLRKEREARGFLADEPGPFPTLAAEAQATAQTIEDLAATIVGMADQWAWIGAAIEAARIGAKVAVSQAATVEAKRAAAVVDWEALLMPGGEG